MATYSIDYTPHYSANPLFQLLGAQPYPVDGGEASNEIAFVAHPMGEALWEEGGMASHGLAHLAYDGHAHDLTDEARGNGLGRSSRRASTRSRRCCRRTLR